MGPIRRKLQKCKEKKSNKRGGKIYTIFTILIYYARPDLVSSHWVLQVGPMLL